MLHKVYSEKVVYSFSSSLQPVLEIESGDEVVFETRDARGGRAMRDSDQYIIPQSSPVGMGNPVTGPIAIKNADRGDSLVIEIEDIKIGCKGYVPTRQDLGVLREMVKNPGPRIINVRNGTILFDEGIRLPTRPMIGTIGVAPPSSSIPSMNSGSHGGNMDCNDIVVGSKVFLPVYTKGALFALGDVHASMGDGEVTGGGLDIGSDVRVRISLQKNLNFGGPLVETGSKIVIIHNDQSLEKAVRGVVEKSVSLIMEKKGLSFDDAYRFTSVFGDVKICACPNLADVVVRMHLPKIFNILNIE